MSKYPELQLDVSLWQNKPDEYIEKDVSSALLEFQREPHLYWLTLEELGNLRSGVRTDNEIYRKEAAALEKSYSWLASGPTRYSAWIAPLREGFYPWSRVILSKKFEENGAIRALNVAVCLPLSPSQCLRCAQAFVDHSPDKPFFDNTEQLRSQPIQFSLPDGKSFADLVKILSGKTTEALFAEKLKATEDAAVLVQDNIQAIRNASSPETKILAGASLEQQVIAMGYAINQFRDCPGVSNMEALRMLGAFDRAYYFGISPKLGKYEYKSGHCRVCKTKTLVGPCNICVPCEKKFDSGELR